MDAIVAKLDDLGKAAWITLAVLGFIIFWPVGLAILAYIIWSGRMGSWKSGGRFGRWYDCGSGREAGHRHRHRHNGGSSGNRAFDEYRTETLRRLEEEEREFREFLERLRLAKDKAEFDQFMAERWNRPRPEAPPAQA